MTGSFYSNAAVRQRLVEFQGGDDLESATAIYLTQSDGRQFDRRTLLVPTEMQRLLDNNVDIARSLADTTSLIFHLDVEYVNFDSQVEAYLDPWRAFALQEPVVFTIERLLLDWGIRPLHIITGQGHHFTWRVDRHSVTAQRISALCPAPELLLGIEAKIPEMLRGRIDHAAQFAFGAMSLIMEYVAHKVKMESAPQTAVPVEITAMAVGPGLTGKREIVSIDISEYGDPLHTRFIRSPFTYYLKPVMIDLIHKPGLDHVHNVRAIPLHEMDVRTALRVRQEECEVQELAHRACVRIPEQGHGTDRLLDEYLASRLRRFHEFFYASHHDPVEDWQHTYYRVPRETFPPCARSVIENPNDALLKPAGMQFVTRCLLARDWHPRHIAGYVRSIFENPIFNWGVRWDDYDAATRADFYIRLCAGLYETGLDELVDFNCTSMLEKGFCFNPSDSGPCLEPLRTKLRNRQCL